MKPRNFRIIEHTADTGFEIRGKTKEELFETAAMAFFQIMWEVGHHENNHPEDITVTGGDSYELLVNFLGEFLYLYDAKGIVFTKIRVKSLTDTEISAKVWSQKFKDIQDRELLAVKAVTYHQLYIGHKGNGWLAQVFLDI